MPQASATFLAKLDLYKKEKPYSIEYEPHGDVPAKNIKLETIEGIDVQDIRYQKSQLTLDKNGIMVRDFGIDMKYEDFANPNVVKHTFIPAIEALLVESLGTANVSVIEYLIRRRDTNFPLPREAPVEYAQPVPRVHIDFSPHEIRRLIVDRYGEARAKVLLQYHYKIVNIWKPLFGPLQDWPLMFCEPRSIKFDDLQPSDIITKTHAEENILLHYDSDQQWIYLDSQLKTEVIIFQGGDSKLGRQGGVPHCAFDISNPESVPRPRESIECRALVFFSDEELALKNLSESRRHGPISSY